MKTIKLTDEQYETLLSELNSLSGYHWHDDLIHADNCGSQVVGIIEAQQWDKNPA